MQGCLLDICSNLLLISLFNYSQIKQFEDSRDFFDKELQLNLPEKQSAESHLEQETVTSEGTVLNIFSRSLSDTDMAIDHVCRVELFLLYTDVPAPYDISVPSIGTDSARLECKCLDSISAFDLRCSSSTSSSIQPLSQNYAEVSGLCPGTEYTFTVVAVSENGNQSSRAKVSAYSNNKFNAFFLVTYV